MCTEIYQYELVNYDSITSIKNIYKSSGGPDEALQELLAERYQPQYLKILASGNAIYDDKKTGSHYLLYCPENL